MCDISQVITWFLIPRFFVCFLHHAKHCTVGSIVVLFVLLEVDTAVRNCEVQKKRTRVQFVKIVNPARL